MSEQFQEESLKIGVKPSISIDSTGLDNLLPAQLHRNANHIIDRQVKHYMRTTYEQQKQTNKQNHKPSQLLHFLAANNCTKGLE